MDNLDQIYTNLPQILNGAAKTLIISALSILFGFISGLTLNLMQSSNLLGLALFTRLYLSIFRGTPLLIQLLFFFYFLPTAGLNVPPFIVAVIALSMNSAAFQAEILRGGFAMIPLGQVEVAKVLQIRPWRTLVHIQIPQVVRLTIPALTNEAIDVVKGSALVSAISVTELMRVTQQVIAVTVRPIEFFAIAALIYLILTVSLTRIPRLLFNKTLNRRN